MFAGVVLAGGASRRMGVDKARLRLADGRTLLQQACEVLHKAGACEVLVSGQGAGGIADRHPDIGPLGGIDAVLDDATSEHLLVIPVDMPRLPPRLLQALAAAAQAETSRCFVGFALPALLSVPRLRRGALQQVLDLTDPRQRSVRALLDQLDSEYLPISDADAALLTNLNTRQQWRAFQEHSHVA